MLLRKTLVLGIAGAALAIGMPALAQSSAPRTLSYPPTGVPLGNGWDSQGVQKTASICIEFDTASSQQGQEVNMERTLVTDQYSYSNALNVSADVQVKSAAGAGVDAKATYASKKQLDSSFMNVVDMVTVNNGWVYAAPKTSGSGLQAARPLTGAMLNSRSPAELQQQRQVHQAYANYFQTVNVHRSVKDKNAAFAMALQRMYLETGHSSKALPPPPANFRSIMQGAAPPPPRLSSAAPGDTVPSVRLTAAAVQILQGAGGPDEFKKVCGDSFVSAIQQGGELAVTYTFQTVSTQEQQDLGASLGVSYGTPVASGSANVSVSQAIASSGTKTNSTVTYFKTGGTGDPIPTTVDAIDAVTQGFAASVAGAPYAYQITVTDYTTLPNFPSGSAGMPALSGFDLVAWEYGKAQTLYTAASQMNAELLKPTANQSYLVSRWGSTRNDVLAVGGAAQQRLDTVQAVARNCLASSTPMINQNCKVDIYDDLTPRQIFPLPVSAGNVADVMAGLWGTDDDYRTAVFERWIGSVNDARCYVRASDPAFCRNIVTVDGLRQGIRVGAPGVVALELVDQPGQCLNYGTVNTYMTQQPCPSSTTSPGFFFAYNPQTRQLSPGDRADQCIMSLRVINAVSPGYGVMGLAGCSVQGNAVEQVTRTWEFRNSLDKNGHPDSTGVYMVVTDQSSPQLNACFDSSSNSSAWVAPCSNPKRLRFWMIASGK